MTKARRILALWLPWFPAERVVRRRPALKETSFVLAAEDGTRTLITAVSPAAHREGLSPGMAVADARAMIPDLPVMPARPQADAAALTQLALWAGRYTPWAAPTTGRSIFLDITGSAHLFGGESGVAEDALRRLGAFGFMATAGVADTPGAAWALAHYGVVRHPVAILPPFSRIQARREALADLPVAALRLPAETAAALNNFGLRLVGDLQEIARKELAARFGDVLVTRLDQLSGEAEEPISPVMPPPEFHIERGFAEPVATAGVIENVLAELLADLCPRLTAAGCGARRLTLTGFGADGKVCHITAGASRPSRDPAAWQRLFREKLPALLCDAGHDMLRLGADETAPLAAEQADWRRPESGAPALAPLIDRLGNRFGFNRLMRLETRQSWWPEHAVRRRDVFEPLSPQDWPADRPRPLRLLKEPVPIAVVAPVPDDPPLLFRWRGRTRRVRAADGPERLLPEWWRSAAEDADAAPRDYYYVEDTDGGRFWLYRAGLYTPERSPRWYLHGFFG